MNRYFKGIRLENTICKIFQAYIEKKRNCKTYLKQRKDKQAPIDFVGRFYDKETNKTITEVAVEVRSLEITKEIIENGYGYIEFPIAKLNELMMFWRMDKEVYIVYLLKDKVFFLKWSYYLKHNFEIGKNKKGNYIKLPIKALIECGEL